MLWSFFLLTIPFIHAALIPTVQDHVNESHRVARRLPTSWYHPDGSPVHDQFKRGPGDGTNYAPVGSPTWSGPFPSSSPDISKLPKAWVDALNAAVTAGKIPNIPQSTNPSQPGQNPTYPGADPSSQEICSSTYKKCRMSGDIWDAPSGYFATSFDDGPRPASSKLLQFLEANNETATHFMIGINILQNPQQFMDIFNSGNDIAVHTWTHPYMTTLSNLEIVGQLGWTAELIRNSTGGRVPKYWRPPYGDSDQRVHAIAKEVFNLTTVIWNQDTEDWNVGNGATTTQVIHDSFVKWISGSKSPGLVVLEHELTDQTVQIFIDNFPMVKSSGWKTGSLARIVGDSVYQNSKDSSSPVGIAGILAGSAPQTQPSPSPSPASSSQSQSQSRTQTTSTTAHASSQSSTSNSALSVMHSMSWNIPLSLLSLCAPSIIAVLFSILG